MRKIELAGLVLLGILFFVFPLPGTISLRDLLLVLVIGVFGYLAWRRGWPGGELRELLVPAVLLATLTAWMVFVALFVSPETAWSLDEITSQWLRGLLALLAGALVSLSFRSNAAAIRWSLATLVVALLVHVIYVDLEGVYLWASGQSFERLSGLAGGPDKSNYMTNMLFCFCFAELVYRSVHRRKAPPLGNILLTGTLVAAFISVFLERMRNGIIVLALVMLAAGLLYLFGQRTRIRKTTLAAGVAALFIVSLGGLGVAATIKPVATSFKDLLTSVSIAWDTKHYTAWRDDKQSAPKLPDGKTIDTSVYQRLAWFKEGLLLVGDHPLGLGFGRNAFGHGLKAKYGQGAGHSHSGLLDMTIGLGIPGALLWSGFFASLATVAWRRCRAGDKGARVGAVAEPGMRNYAAVLLFLLVLDYGLRMVLDSVVRDHMLQQFMLLAALAAVMMATAGPATEKSPA